MLGHKSKRLALATALASLLGAVVVPGATAVTFSGSITASDATHENIQVQSTASSCAAPNTSFVFPVPFPFNYDAYTLANQSAAASCVTVRAVVASSTRRRFVMMWSLEKNPVATKKRSPTISAERSAAHH